MGLGLIRRMGRWQRKDEGAAKGHRRGAEDAENGARTPRWRPRSVLAGAGLGPAPTADLGLGARWGVCRALRQNASDMGALFD